MKKVDSPKAEEKPKFVQGPAKIDNSWLAKQQEETKPAEKPKPAPAKIDNSWMKKQDSPKAEEKPKFVPGPSKIDNSWMKKTDEEKPKFVPAAAPKKLEQTDDFKNSLASMLARGPMGRAMTVVKKPEPVEEENKEKIKLTVFDEDSGDEETKMEKMFERQNNLAKDETTRKLSIAKLAKERRPTTIRKAPSDFDDF